MSPLFLWSVVVVTQCTAQSQDPFLIVLGIAQDGGVPQAGTANHPGWTDAGQRKLVVSLAVVDPATSERWLFEATPDFRRQLYRLDMTFPVDSSPGLTAILLTHAHIGHYAGLMFLGHESMGSTAVPVYAMPRMCDYLRSNGPWSQLVRYGNIELRMLAAGSTVDLNSRISMTPFLVPHRQEYSEVVGFRIDGPNRSVLFIPDIDSWEELDSTGTRIEDLVRAADIAYLDATFFNGSELPGRDMSGFPHPFIEHSTKRFERLPASERGKVRFIHLNHTNPALRPDSEARKQIIELGFRVAEEMEIVNL